MCPFFKSWEWGRTFRSLYFICVSMRFDHIVWILAVFIFRKCSLLFCSHEADTLLAENCKINCNKRQLERMITTIWCIAHLSKEWVTLFSYEFYKETIAIKARIAFPVHAETFLYSYYWWSAHMKNSNKIVVRMKRLEMTNTNASNLFISSFSSIFPKRP